MFWKRKKKEVLDEKAIAMFQAYIEMRMSIMHRTLTQMFAIISMLHPDEVDTIVDIQLQLEKETADVLQCLLNKDEKGLARIYRGMQDQILKEEIRRAPDGNSKVSPRRLH